MPPDEARKPPLLDERTATAGKAWSKALAGPALSAMVVLVIAVLAGWTAWGYRWTSASEVLRVHYIGGIGAVLAVIIGVVYLALEGGIRLRGGRFRFGTLVEADVQADEPQKSAGA